MAKRDSFLLRLNPRILAGIRQWSEDEMRSMNSQIEFLLRQSLQKAGRLPSPTPEPEPPAPPPEDVPPDITPGNDN